MPAQGGVHDRMPNGKATGPRVFLALLALLSVCALSLAVPRASAVSTQGNVAVTVTPSVVSEPASYNIGRFRTANGETVTGYTLTFPADTDASAVTSPGVGDVVTVAADNRTVTVVFGTPIPQRTTFYLDLSGVIGPSTAGTYSIASVTFTRQGAGSQTIDTSARTYTIAPPPYLYMTITTPDPGQSVDFGTIDVDVTTPGESVTVDVDSGAPYSISRSVAGDVAAMGLAVTGAASGTGLPAGPSTYVDSYTATPPWTTPADTALTAVVTYTVVQD